MERETRSSEHVYVQVLRDNDHFAYNWLQGPLNYTTNDQQLVRIHYAAINVRDVTLATAGRLSVDTIDTSRIGKGCELGLEFAGINQNGEKVWNTRKRSWKQQI